jgi:hypothetical protein
MWLATANSPARRDLIDPTIAVHHGRAVKRTGGGLIVEFSGVVDAARGKLSARARTFTRLRGQGLKDNVSANALQIFQPYSNWEATCVTVFEQYWRLRYRFG